MCWVRTRPYICWRFDGGGALFPEVLLASDNGHGIACLVRNSYIEPVEVLLTVCGVAPNQIPRFISNLKVCGDLAFTGFDELCFDANIPYQVFFAKPIYSGEHEKWVGHGQHRATEGCSNQVAGKDIGFVRDDSSRSVVRDVFRLDAST